MNGGRAALWLGGGALSLSGHGALFLLLGAAIAPEPPPPSNPTQGGFDIASYPVRETRSEARTPEGDALPEDSADGVETGGLAVPQTQAAAQEVQAPQLSETPPAGAVVRAQEDGASPLAAVAPPAPQATIAPPSGAVLVPQQAAQGAVLPAQVPDDAVVSQRPIEVDRTAPTDLSDEKIAVVAAEATPITADEQDALPVAAQRLSGESEVTSPLSPEAGRVQPTLTSDDQVVSAEIVGKQVTTLPLSPDAMQGTLTAPDAPLVQVVAGPSARLDAVINDDTAVIKAVQTAGARLAEASEPAAPLLAVVEMGAVVSDIAAPETPTVQPASFAPAPTLDALTDDGAVVMQNAPPAAAQIVASLAQGTALSDQTNQAVEVGQQADLPQASAPSADMTDLATAPPALNPPSGRRTAALAWSGEGEASLDEVSLAAIQAF